MLKFKQGRTGAGIIGILALLGAVLLSPPVFAQTADIDAQAVRLLKASTDCVASLGKFNVDTASTLEVVLHSGQKIQYDHVATLSLQRPNKLRADRRGDLVDQTFFYDGKSLTMYNPGDKYFAASEAPGTLEEMLDFAREKLDIIAPAGDFLYKNAFEILMDNVSSAFVVGKSVVNGVRCDHLAFRSAASDWQLWVQEENPPLPRKLVITSTDIPGSPQFTVVMPKWNLDPVFAADFFDFKNEKDAKRIDFLPVGRNETPAK